MFSSFAPDLVPGDTNQSAEIFVRDRWANTTTLLSAAPEGSPSDGDSLQPAMSADGRYVTYVTAATNIISRDPCLGRTSILVLLDRQTGEMSRVDVPFDGSPCVDAQVLGFPAISADGRYLAYWSLASNLTSARRPGLFLFDRVTHITTQVASGIDQVTGVGVNEERPALSGDGRYVAFTTSTATVVPGDTNAHADVFVYDRSTGATRRVSVSAARQQANGDSDYVSINANGRYIAYWTNAGNLAPHDHSTDAKVLVWDRKAERTRRTRLIFHRPFIGLGFNTTITPKGSAVAMISGSTLYLWDRATGRTTRISESPTGAQEDGVSSWPAFAGGNGRYITFTSAATNLVPGDTNQRLDVFVRDRFPQ